MKEGPRENIIVINERAWESAFYLALLAITILLCLFNYNVPFYYDDFDQILVNFKLHHLSQIKDIIFCGSRQNRIFQNLTFALNWALSGPKYWSYHVFNNSLHLFNSYLVFRLMAYIAPRRKMEAMVTALLFLVHPLGNQSITYIMGRVELLKTLFTLAIICVYLGQEKNIRRMVIIFTLLIISLTVKETCVLIPLYLLGIDFFVRGKSFRELVTKEHALYLSHVIWLVPYSLWIGSPEKFHEGAVGLTLFPAWEYLLVQLHYLTFYIFLFFNPAEQSIYHDYPGLGGAVIPMAALGLVIYLTALLYLGKKKNKEGAVCFMLFFGLVNFIPYSSLLQFVNPFAEYRLYASNITLIFLMVHFLYLVPWGNWARRSVLSLFFLFFLVFILIDIMNWKNPLRVWDFALQNYPHSFVINNNMANIYFAMDKIDQTFPYLREAEKSVKFYRERITVEKNLGLYYQLKKNNVMAKKYYDDLFSQPVNLNYLFYYNYLLLLREMGEQGKIEVVKRVAEGKFSGSNLEFILRSLPQARNGHP